MINSASSKLLRAASALVLVSCALVAGCAKTAVGQAQSSNGEIPVSKLLEVEGCTVFRFSDAGHYRYIAKCEGAASATVSGRVSCGKSCTREDSLMAVNVDSADDESAN